MIEPVVPVRRNADGVRLVINLKDLNPQEYTPILPQVRRPLTKRDRDALIVAEVSGGY